MKSVARASAFSLLLSLGFGLAGCSGVSYNSDYDPTIDFSGFQTYVWATPPQDAGPNPRGVDQISERRIASAVDAQLAEKGYRLIEYGEPDFVVNFILTTQQKVDYTTYNSGWGYYGYYGGGVGVSHTTAREWTEGTLLIDVIDVKEQDLAWRGWANGALSENLTPEQKTQRVNEVVGKILEKFPPQS